MMCLHIKYFLVCDDLGPFHIYTVFQKTSTFLFFNNSVMYQPIVIIFGTQHPDEYGHMQVYNILMNMAIRRLQICPSHLYTVAALPWEMTKVCFQQCYYYVFPNT